ncbi:MAG: DNA polymerase IV [Bacteroidaceae bacterium]|nr:DNA polymerase IV [Bacteroidaceae bacterium]
MDDQRKIIHIDMDAFFASVEQRDDPSLRGRPLAVGYDGPRGVVSTASYEARRFGVHSAQAMATAKRLCPSLVIVPGRYSVYKQVSAQMHDIFHEYTDLIEPISLDEAFLDVTSPKTGTRLATDIAREIKQKIRERLSLTASAGISYCKFLAKIASDLQKPDGLTVIHPARAQAFINDLRVERLWGVGPRSAEALHRIGIFTGKDLRERSLPYLTERFGKMGTILYNFARGIDNRPVQPTRVRKSVGCERTFEHDLQRPEEFDEAIVHATDELVHRLQRTQFQGQTLTLKVKFADFHQITRSLTLEGQQTILPNAEAILPLARQLFYDSQAAVQSVRLIGLSVSHSASQESALAHAYSDTPSDDFSEHWIQLELPFRPWDEVIDE